MALIPLITPVAAVILGAVFLDETITLGIGAGALLLLVALAIRQEIRIPSKSINPCEQIGE